MLKVWLPLDGDLRNLGASNIEVINNGATVNNNGKIGKCYYFDGNGHYLQLSESVGNLYSGDFSWAVWLKPTDSTRSIISSEYSSTGSSNVAFELTASRGVRIYWNGSPDIYPANSTLPIDTWTHVAITKTTGIIKTYLNGQLTNTYTGTLSDRPSTSKIRIGDDYRGGTSVSYMGYMNDWRLYNHCLSAAEVHEIAMGLVLHYKLDGQMGGSGINLFRNTDFWCTATSSQTATVLQTPSYIGNLQDLVGKTITFSFELYTPGERQNGSGNLGGRFGAHLSLNYTPNGGSATQAYPCASHLTDTISTEHYRVYSTAIIPSNCTINSFGMAIQPFARPANSNTTTWKIGQFKVEFGDKPTFYSPAPQDLGINTSVITDSSGYNHNGTLVSPLPPDTTSPRYNIAYQFSGNVAHRIYCNTTNFNYTDNFSYALWCRANYTGTAAQYLFTVGRADAGGYGYGIQNNSSTNLVIRFGNQIWNTQIETNTWTHIAFVKSGTTIKIYKNGVLYSTNTFSGTLPTYSDGNGLGLGCFHYSGDIYPGYGAISDFRIYCTPLLDNDIKMLYNVSMKVDNLGGIHTFEFNENSLSSLKKQGILTNSHFSENGYQEILQYDKNIYTEPDGSTWIHIFHHNNPANGLFSSSTNWKQGIYLDSNRWYDIEKIIPNLIQYEFMVKQKTTSDATEIKYRWIQNTSPLNAVYADVKPGTCTYNTASGYTNSSLGGLYILNSNTHFCIANNSNGNWYGAIGCWTIYNGGIPGYPNTTVTSGYIDLYARVYLPAKIIKNLGINAIEFIEI